LFYRLYRVTCQAPSRSARRKKIKRQIRAEAKKEFREVWNSLILVWLELGWLYHVNDLFHLLDWSKGIQSMYLVCLLILSSLLNLIELQI
jgi:hypothetical protein